jgi:hypothetical protein
MTLEIVVKHLLIFGVLANFASKNIKQTSHSVYQAMYTQKDCSLFNFKIKIKNQKCAKIIFIDYF